MLNVIAFGPCFFDSIKDLGANMHRAIARDLLSSKFVYMIHRDNPAEGILFSSLVDSLLGLNDDKADACNEQVILIWRRFLQDVYRYKSNRLLPKNFYEFFGSNKQHAKSIWMHSSDAEVFGLVPSQYSKLCFEGGVASDDFHIMLNRRHFNKAFSDEANPESLLAILDDQILDLPSQFYKTIILFDKYMAWSFFKHQYTGVKHPYKGTKDPNLDGFVRFLRHLEQSSQSIVTGVVLIGEYPLESKYQLLTENNTKVALETLQNRSYGKHLLSGLQVEVMFVCPWDFPSVYHDRYCAWSSNELDHDSDETYTRFLDYFELSFGNSERMEFCAADFWLQSGRGLQVYEEVTLHRSWQNVTFDWASDIEALEYDLFYRFLSWPKNVEDTTKRYKWASIDGHSCEHGFSDVCCVTL